MSGSNRWIQAHSNPSCAGLLSDSRRGLRSYASSADPCGSLVTLGFLLPLFARHKELIPLGSHRRGSQAFWDLIDGIYLPSVESGATNYRPLQSDHPDPLISK